MTGVQRCALPILETIWLEKWQKETNFKDENEQLIPRQDIDWGGDTPEYHCNEGLRLLTNPEILNGILSIQAASDDFGVMVERKIELNVPGVPIPIIGYIDIITEDFIPGDLKTSSTSWSVEKANTELQPLYYLAAMNQMGMKTEEWKFRHFIFVKTKTPKFQMIEHYHNPSQLIWLFKVIKNVWEAIEKGVFHENPLTWKCNSKWCDYYMQCRGKYE